MRTLTTMKFDGSCTICDHVNKMTSIEAKHNLLEMEVDESFCVQLILNSLPSQYGPF